MESKVRRIITKFHHDGDDCKGEIDVTHIPFEELQRTIQMNSADPLMYDCDKLNAIQLAALQQYVREKIELTRYDYHLEAEGE
jgi:hypothetical protein